jgi:uncharacterized protein involved in response to NO
VLVAAKSRRNYGIVAVLAVLWLAQLTSHAGALESDILLQRRGVMLGLDLILLLIVVIGGRVIPMFTRNSTGVTDIRSHAWLERAAIASVLACAVADAALLQGLALAIVMGLAALLTAIRALHWGTQHALRDPLLWVLHAGYLCVPLGFALRAAAELTPVVRASPALHVLTVGAIGMLTLGMMARVSLGHTGRLLECPRVVTAAFALLVLATIARVAGVMLGGHASTPSLHLAAAAWSLAFLLYLARIGPMLVTRRPDGTPG